MVKALKLYGEKGITLVELTVVMVIIGMLGSVFVVNISCVSKDLAYTSDIALSNKIYSSITSYYKSTGTLPLDEVVSPSDVEGYDVIVNRLDDEWGIDPLAIEKLFDTGNVRKVQRGSLRLDGSFDESDLARFGVIFVGNDETDVDLVSLRKLNGTLIPMESVSNCDDEEFTLILGNERNAKVSESLRFELNDDYIDCPNSLLCDRLN